MKISTVQRETLDRLIKGDRICRSPKRESIYRKSFIVSQNNSRKVINSNTIALLLDKGLIEIESETNDSIMYQISQRGIEVVKSISINNAYLRTRG